MREVLEMLQEQDGMVIGENHASRSPLKFLIDNVSKFKTLGIRYLFLERFGSDFNRNYESYFSDKVNDGNYEKHFNEKWEKPFSRQLIAANININEKRKPLIDDEDVSNYTLKNLLITMKKYEIIIIGINPPSSLCYGLNVYAEPKDRKILAQRMNKHMSEYIREFISVNEGKFLVLCGAAHAYKYVAIDGEEVKGLSTSLNCKSVYICEDGFDDIFLNDNKEKSLSQNRLISGVSFRIFEERRLIKPTIEHMVIDYMWSLRVIPNNVNLVKPHQYILVSKFRESSVGYKNSSRWLFFLEQMENTTGGEDDFKIGFSYYDKQKYQDALNFFRRAAQKDNSNGMYMTGMMFYEAKGCEKNIEKAIEFLISAAKRNHPDANYNLSRIFRFNLKNNSKANLYLEKAFLLGHNMAVNEWKDLNLRKNHDSSRKLSL